jgi:hypothetical protein
VTVSYEVGERLGDEDRLDDDFGVGHECRRLGVPVTAEAEERGRGAELLREVWEGRDADAAADEQRALDLEAVAIPEGPVDVELIACFRRRQRPRSRSDCFEQERQLTRRCLAEAHRAGKRTPRRLEHEELARDARIQAASLDPHERVGADRLVRNDSKPFASAH